MVTAFSDAEIIGDLGVTAVRQQLKYLCFCVSMKWNLRCYFRE